MKMKGASKAQSSLGSKTTQAQFHSFTKILVKVGVDLFKKQKLT